MLQEVARISGRERSGTTTHFACGIILPQNEGGDKKRSSRCMKDGIMADNCSHRIVTQATHKETGQEVAIKKFMYDEKTSKDGVSIRSMCLFRLRLYRRVKKHHLREEKVFVAI